jgi:hypothetical protein
MALLLVHLVVLDVSLALVTSLILAQLLVISLVEMRMVQAWRRSTKISSQCF